MIYYIQNKLFIFCLIPYLFGCSYMAPISTNEYEWKIKNWQTKIQKYSPKQHHQAGWDDKRIEKVVNDCLDLVVYEPDQNDNDSWDAYNEFDLKGDCEDIATFIYQTLKGLGCPNEIRMTALRLPLGDHAVLKIKMSNGKWKIFNSVRVTGMVIDMALGRSIVEWDDNYIYYQ